MTEQRTEADIYRRGLDKGLSHLEQVDHAIGLIRQRVARLVLPDDEAAALIKDILYAELCAADATSALHGAKCEWWNRPPSSEKPEGTP